MSSIKEIETIVSEMLDEVLSCVQDNGLLYLDKNEMVKKYTHKILNVTSNQLQDGGGFRPFSDD